MHALVVVVLGSAVVIFLLYMLKQWLAPNCVLISDIDYNGLQCSVVGIGNEGYRVILQLSDDEKVSIDGLYGHYKVSCYLGDAELMKVVPTVKFADYLNILSTIHEDRYETTYYQLHHMLQIKDFKP